MIKKIIDIFKNLDKTTCSIMKSGIKFCFIITIISCIILFTYIQISRNPIYYYFGLSLFKLSINLIIDFIICGIVVENIKKQNI